MRSGPSLIMLLFAAPIAVLLLSAQNSPTTPPLPEPDARGPDRLVEQRTANLSASRSRINSRGGGGNLNAMTAIVRSYFRAFARSVQGITDAEKLDDLDAEQLAIFLTTAGYDPNALGGDRKRSESLVRSASNVLFGQSTINDEVAVSPVVFVGRLTSVQPDNSPGDGFRSTVSFDITRLIKGNLTNARVRQRSGPMDGGEQAFVSGEFTSEMAGREFLIFATSDAYRFRARSTPASAPEGGGYLSMILAPYEVINGTGRPMVVGQTSSGFSVTSLSGDAS